MGKSGKTILIISCIGLVIGGIYGGIAWSNYIKQFNSVYKSSSVYENKKSHASIVDDTLKFTSKKSGTYYDFEVTGKIINDGDYNLQYVYVEAIFYNTSGEQVDYSNMVTGSLSVGEVALFTVTDLCKQDATKTKVSLEWLNS